MEDALVQAIDIRAEGVGIHVCRDLGILLDPGIHHIQMGQKFRLRKCRRHHSTMLHRAMMGQNHMCQKRNPLSSHTLHFGGLQKKQHAQHRMADKLALAAVVRDQSVLGQLELPELANIVQEHAGHKEVPVDVRILAGNGIRCVEH